MAVTRHSSLLFGHCSRARRIQSIKKEFSNRDPALPCNRIEQIGAPVFLIDTWISQLMGWLVDGPPAGWFQRQEPAFVIGLWQQDGERY